MHTTNVINLVVQISEARINRGSTVLNLQRLDQILDLHPFQSSSRLQRERAKYYKSITFIQGNKLECNNAQYNTS